MGIFEVKWIRPKNGMKDLCFKNGGVPNNEKRKSAVLGVGGWDSAEMTTFVVMIAQETWSPLVGWVILIATEISIWNLVNVP